MCPTLPNFTCYIWVYVLDSLLENITDKPTDEETKNMLDKMEKFYDEQLPFLRKKHEFDTMNAEIDEARIRSLAAKDQFARFMLQQKEGKLNQTESSDKK